MVILLDKIHGYCAVVKSKVEDDCEKKQIKIEKRIRKKFRIVFVISFATNGRACTRVFFVVVVM